MANEEMLAILKQGSGVWNRWRKEQPRDSRIDLSKCKLVGADLSNVDLCGADLRGSNLGGVDFSGALLDNANFTDTILYEANLQCAHLLKACFSKSDLIGANIISSDLTGASFSGANLLDADLSDADLREADFSDANLTNAVLSCANLGGANLVRTYLDGAALKGSQLIWTNFQATSLSKTNFDEARFGYTILADIDFSEAISLETATHACPSTIGLDTLFKSHGSIPDSFLRDAGVDEDVINHLLPSIRSGPPIQWHSCFISYSTKDEEFARALHSRMRAANLRVWFAPEDLQGGKKLHEQLFDAIQMHDKLLLLLSENSLQSEWVMTEIRKAREIERKEKRRKLFPIRLTNFDTLRNWTCFDADSGKDLAVELREYFIPDFSNWKDHDAFEAAFNRLLSDLKA